MSSGVVLTKEATDFSVIDWVHTRTGIMEDILSRSELDLPTSHELEKRLVAYVLNTDGLQHPEWGLNTLRLNGCPDDEMTEMVLWSENES